MAATAADAGRPAFDRAGCGRPPGRRAAAYAGLWLALWTGSSASGPALAHELADVIASGHYDQRLGSSDAASEGVIGPELIRSRPLLRPAEVLENIPGVVVTQHSGDGKANQYFLRGMNLDHGTDFATTLNGVPMNLPTHAHGQGYTDLGSLMPELVSRIDYRKGPYFASEGDFSSAGSADIRYRTRLEAPLASLTLGSRGYLREFAAFSKDLPQGVGLLTAWEQVRNRGPWTVPEGLHKLNALLTLSDRSGPQSWSTSASLYRARWNSTDQVPQRLIDQGSFQGRPFGRFDSVDPSDGGQTQRASLSGLWQHASEHTQSSLRWYWIGYRLDLFSNFTYALERASDQFLQRDRRSVWGGEFKRSHIGELGSATPVQHTWGLQLRQDRIRLGLDDTQARQLQSVVRLDQVRQTSLAAHAESEVQWSPGFKSVLGLRVDGLQVQVDSALNTDNSGRAWAQRLSPKLSLVWRAHARHELFFNAGRGFHSNDARGITARTDPRTGQPVDAVPALVGSRGRELGWKSQWTPAWLNTLALWQLDFDSELVYEGDTGSTSAGRPSRRSGVEWSQHWTPSSRVWLDLTWAWSRPRYSDADPVGALIPNAVQKVAQATLTLRDLGAWSGSLALRSVGSAPLTEDGRTRSAASVTVNARAQRQWGPRWMLSAEVLNLANRANNDISYFYASRVPGEPLSGVAGLHVHPADPRTLRLSVLHRF